jgi:hypothetical protein
VDPRARLDDVKITKISPLPGIEHYFTNIISKYIFYLASNETTELFCAVNYQLAHTMTTHQKYKLFVGKRDQRLISYSNLSLSLPITVAARSKARSNTGIVGSNPTRGMDVCVRLLRVRVVLCVGSGLATGLIPPPRSPTDCV